MIRSGWPASISDSSAAAPTTPASASPRSAAYTFVAPCSPSEPAIASGLGPTYTASTSPSSRALVSSSSVLVAGLSPSGAGSAYTQIFTMSLLAGLDDLELLEERHDL